MIEMAETENTDLINQVICHKMQKLEKHPMDRALTEILAMLLMTPKGKFNVPEAEKPQLMQLVGKRIEHRFTYKITDQRLVFFIAALAQRPALAVLYMWYLQGWCYAHNVREIDLSDLSMRIFPMGFFSEGDLMEVWSGQKVRGEHGLLNLADMQTAGESIQFKD